MCSSNLQAPRQPHASLDLASRQRKAVKIVRLMQLDRYDALRVLEIGCGSGVIAHYLAHLDHPRCDVFAVDVKDQRVLTDGYHFQPVQDCRLPFSSESFDLIISNHVIEHVGDENEQAVHLDEIRRLLKQDGRAYLATPSRWAWIEPHYHVPFLSWPPKRLRSAYLRAWRRGLHYDCAPLSAGELRRCFARAGLIPEDLVSPAIRETLAVGDGNSVLLRVLTVLPACLHRALSPLSPTLIYSIRRVQQACVPSPH